MNEKNSGKKQVVGFLRNNLVYVAMSVALLALGVLGVGRILNATTKNSEKQPLTDEMVEQTVTGEPDTRSTTTTTQKATATTSTKATKTEEEVPELYVFPLSNMVQKAFSATEPVYCETMNSWRLHLGVDFAGKKGQKVKALARGTVSKVENDPLWGDVIEIDHGVGVVSRYCGAKASVREGDQVGVGEAIGTLSEIPCEMAQNMHLHLEMTIDGTPVNPVEVIGKEVRYGDTLEE